MTPDDISTSLLYLFGLIVSIGLGLNVVFLVRLCSRRAHRKPIQALPDNTIWTALETIKLIGLLALGHILLYVGILVSSKVFGFSDSRLSIMAFAGQVLLFHGVIVAYAAIVVRRKHGSWVALMGLSIKGILRNVVHGIAYYMAAMPAIFLAGWVYIFLLQDLGYPVEPDDVQDVVQLLRDTSYPAWARIGAGLIGVTLVPLAEEILFRFIALRLLSRHVGTGIAVFLVSACFAFLHMHIPSVAPLFVFSIALSWGYMHSGSLIIPFIMHSVFNTVIILSILLTNSTG